MQCMATGQCIFSRYVLTYVGEKKNRQSHKWMDRSLTTYMQLAGSILTPSTGVKVKEESFSQ